MPRDPGNVGNIGRAVVGLGKRLILVGPFGFKLDSSSMKRAQLDYWDSGLDVEVFPNFSSFVSSHPKVFEKGSFFSARQRPEQQHCTLDVAALDEYAVFGSETNGLDHISLPANCQFVSIPMQTTMRSYNLASAASMVLWEAFAREQRAFKKTI